MSPLLRIVEGTCLAVHRVLIDSIREATCMSSSTTWLMNQTPTIHSQTVMSDSDENGFSSVSTKYDNTARNARYAAYIHRPERTTYTNIIIIIIIIIIITVIIGTRSQTVALSTLHDHQPLSTPSERLEDDGGMWLNGVVVSALGIRTR